MKAPLHSLDLAVTGNGQISTLIDAHGTIVWSCMPRPDSDPVFARLLATPDRPAHAAAFGIDLRNLAHATQTYERNTAIVVTELTDASGACVRITDFCPRFRLYGRIFHP
ncbi:MAG: glycoside hydrolase family 15 protein, partial [Proteobacteria bacterium]